MALDTVSTLKSSSAMKTNVFFKRIIIIVLSGVFLTSILSAALYMTIARRVFINIRADELMPVARTIASLVGEKGVSGISDISLISIIQDEKLNFLDADLTVADETGEIVSSVSERNTGGAGPPRGALPSGVTADVWSAEENELVPEVEFPTGLPQPDSFSSIDGVPGIITELAGLVFADVRDSGEVVTTVNTTTVDYLVVASPITGEDGSFLGAVIITKKVEELSNKLDGLNITLIASAFAAFFIMLIPAYIAGRNLTNPINDMQRVAKAMSEGDYTVRADENVSGELGELARSMNEFAEKSAKLEQTRRDYVANISHELRTPIASIRAMSETLRDGLVEESEKKQRYYDHILRESLRLSRLVDDLLELSRLQSQGVAAVKEKTDILPVLISSATTFMQIATDAEIEFNFEYPESLPLVYTNSDRIAQVLVILLDNAMKHTPAGGRVLLKAEAGEQALTVSVHDTGEGIAEEDLPNVFERFYKSDKSRATGGTGLGLSIAYEVLLMLGEKISARSVLGEGSVFSFTIQIAD